MKALPKILFALTAVAALSVAYPVKANLITNGGFETGDLTGWMVLGVTPFVVGAFAGVSPHSGNFQVTDPIGLAAFEQTLATTPGQSYTVDFWVADNVGGLVQVFWGNSIVFAHIFTEQTDYT